jgi:SAM-dependent methyltransferase
MSGEIEALPRPDPSIWWVGEEDGGRRGIKQLRLLEHWGLEPSSQVLEIGCGVGRLAYELAPYLADGAGYAGFDISADAIDWLNENYASRLPSFRFDHMDVHNARYRPDASTAAHEIRFPYADNSFDVACAFEVFMHMQPPDVANYLSEVARVLRPGRAGIMTFMAITEADPAPVFSGRPFVPVGDGVYTRFPERDGLNLAYGDGLIRQMITDAGLRLIDTVEGRWHAPLRPASDGPEHNADVYVVSPG